MKPQVYDRHQLEREKERYRISIGLGVAIAGWLSLLTVDRPKHRAAWFLTFGVIAIGAGVVVLREESNS